MGLSIGDLQKVQVSWPISACQNLRIRSSVSGGPTSHNSSYVLQPGDSCFLVAPQDGRDLHVICNTQNLADANAAVLLRLFEAWDRNRDGHVSWPEFQEMLC